MRGALRSALACAAAVAVAAAVAPAAQAADTTPPTVPTNLRVGEVTPTTVQLRFDRSRDNVQVNGYIVEGGPRPEYAGDGYAFMQLLTPGETYTFRVRAFDSSNNQSGLSAPVTVTTPQFRRPAQLRLTSQDRGTVSLAWESSPDMTGGYDLVYVDGQLERIGHGRTTIRHLAPGSHSITVKSADYYGRLTPASAPLTVSVEPAADRTPPTAPGNLTNAFDEATCLFDVRWTAATDDVDPEPVYDLFVRDWLTGGQYVVAYDVRGTSVENFSTDVTGVRAADSAGNVSVVTRAG
jgi:fibronectin type III domain protein